MSSKKNEKPLSTFLKKNKVLTFPLLALVPSILIVLIFIFVTALLYIIFLIPIIIFIAAHYTDTWGMKKRLKYAIPVFVLLLLIQTLILTPVSYENPGILQGKTPNDSHFSVYIIVPANYIFHQFRFHTIQCLGSVPQHEVHVHYHSS